MDDRHSSLAIRSLWARQTPEEAHQDRTAYAEACAECGRFLAVLWCELVQLAGDVSPCLKERL